MQIQMECCCIEKKLSVRSRYLLFGKDQLVFELIFLLLNRKNDMIVAIVLFTPSTYETHLLPLLDDDSLCHDHGLTLLLHDLYTRHLSDHPIA